MEMVSVNLFGILLLQSPSVTAPSKRGLLFPYNIQTIISGGRRDPPLQFRTKKERTRHIGFVLSYNFN